MSANGDCRARPFAIAAPEQAPAIKYKWFPSLDGLRGLAILLVMLFHYNPGLNRHDPIQHAIAWGAISAGPELTSSLCCRGS